MGNCKSTATIVPQPDTCLVCWNTIEEGRTTTCMQCHINMHQVCEKIYRRKRKYNHCPHCRQRGMLAVII